MSNEVKIKLTDAQKDKIREATGKDLPEIRVENFGSNPALSASDVTAPKHISAMRKMSAKRSAKLSAKRSAKLSAKRSAKVSAKRSARVSAKRSAKKGAF